MFFAVQCPGHGSSVLMFEHNIQGVVNTPTGIDVHYRCPCGHRGVWHTGRRRGGVAGANRTDGATMPVGG